MSADRDASRLAFLVHEVRSPVAALAAIAEALSDDGLELDAVRRLVGIAVAACRGIELVLRDAPLGVLELAQVDLGDLVRDAVTTASLGGARVRLVIDGVAPSATCDPLRLRQALDNLISNAVAHSPDGGEIVVLVGVRGSEITISVTDHGSGIPIGQQARIFEPGVRLQTDRPGSGLGLAVAREVVEAHEGVLTVASAPGKGATFTIALPLSPR
jgi:signal transduction histidine kinase